MATDGTGKMFEELKKIEARIGSDGHMCGGQFTLADLFAFVTIGQSRAGFLDGIPEAMRGEAWWEEKLPKLKKVFGTVGAAPAVKAYYLKRAMSSELYRPRAEQAAK